MGPFFWFMVEKKKNKGGRPTRYKSEFAGLAYNYALLGATDVEMADFFGVTEKTFNNWKKAHKEFLQSLKAGKVQADAVVGNKLYQRACGYEHPEVKVFNHGGEIVTHEVVKHYPPDSTAAIFWLKNRSPKKWRDKQDVDLTVTTSLADALRESDRGGNG